MILPYIVLIVSANSVVAHSHSCNDKLDVSAHFKTAKIQPDIVEISPTNKLKIRFNNEKYARLGNELTPTEVKDIPTLDWQADKELLYTLTFSDPDAPSTTDAEEREFLHWLVVNIPGKDVSKGDTLVEYIGSGPGNGTGKHRYTYLVFQQPGRINPGGPKASNTTFEGRIKFHTKEFAKTYNLGNPIAGNFYLAQWDEYVSVISHQLGF